MVTKQKWLYVLVLHGPLGKPRGLCILNVCKYPEESLSLCQSRRSEALPTASVSFQCLPGLHGAGRTLSILHQPHCCSVSFPSTSPAAGGQREGCSGPFSPFLGLGAPPSGVCFFESFLVKTFLSIVLRWFHVNLLEFFTGMW